MTKVDFTVASTQLLVKYMESTETQQIKGCSFVINKSPK